MLIDEAGTKAIAGWMKKETNEHHLVSFTINETIVTLSTNTENEFGTLKLILMRNGIRFDIDKISKN
jgi:hypothetical protein